MKIEFNNLKRGYEIYKSQYEAKALEILGSGWYIMGKELKNFEQEFAQFHNVKYCIGVDNGLNAITLGIKSLDIGAEDEVIIQSNTYIATIMAISANGATPILVEPDEYFNMDVKKISEKITAKTKAIVVTHLYGQASNMEKIMKICEKHNLILLEDCAQSHFAEFKGKKVGTFGKMGFFSFYPTKNMGAFGDAGAVITDDSSISDKIFVLRNYGSKEKYQNEIIGTNARLDELQAGLLSIKLSHIHEINARRQNIADAYLDGIVNNKVTLPKILEGSTSVWHLFVVRVAASERNLFREHLLGKGISTEIHYPIPPHLSEAYKSLNHVKGKFPIAEEYADSVVSLPIFDGMEEMEANAVINAVNMWK